MISFTNKNIMVVVAHQDDETLFAGGFLTNICENCSIILIWPNIKIKLVSEMMKVNCYMQKQLSQILKIANG